MSSSNDHRSALFPRWKQVSGFLSSAEHAELLQFAQDHESQFEQTTVAASGDEARNIRHRSSRKLVTGLGEWKPRLRARLAEIFPAVCDEVGLKDPSFARIELEIVAHNDGDHFGRHLDTLYYGSRSHEKTARFLSGVYYFFREPRPFSGGELRMFPFDSQTYSTDYVDIVPQNNSIVFFPAFAAHEVLTVTCNTGAFRDCRFSVNCWFHRELR